MPVNLTKKLRLSALPVLMISISLLGIAKAEKRSVTLYDAEFIKKNGKINLVDILREAPGLSVSRAGYHGAPVSVHIRGAESNHTLVFIDGVKVNSPLSGEYDFAHLLSFDIERVEIIRGAGSTLYGSGAIGGIIQITTKKANSPLKLETQTQLSSAGAYTLSARFAEKNETRSYALSASFFKINSPDAFPSGLKKDSSKNLNLKIYAETKISDRLSAHFTFSHIGGSYNNNTISPSTLNTDDQLVNKAEYHYVQNTHARVQINLSSFQENLQSHLGVSYLNNHQKNEAVNDTIFDTHGKILKFDFQSSYERKGENISHSLTGIAEYKQLYFDAIYPTIKGIEQIENDHQISIIGSYNLQLPDDLSLNVNARYDHNEIFNDAFTYNIAASWKLESETRIYASHATAVTDPTFHEKYGLYPNFFKNNENLKPERTAHYEMGIEQTLVGGKLIFDFAFFIANLRNEIYIDYSSALVSSPINITNVNSQRKGVEFSTHANIAPHTYLTASYSFLIAKEPISHTSNDLIHEIRRPKNMAAVSVNHRFEDDMGYLNFGFILNGERDDKDFSANYATRVKLKSYLLVHASVSYKITQNIEAFIRAENILNKSYQETYGYDAQGFNLFIGLRSTF